MHKAPGQDVALRRTLGMDFLSQDAIDTVLKNWAVHFASNVRRLVAYFIDLGITLSLVYMIMVKGGGARFLLGPSAAETLAKVTFLLWAWLVFPMYYGACAFVSGKTIGCWIAGISVITASGKRPGFMRGCLRGWVMGTLTAVLFPVLIGLHTIYVVLSWRKNRLKMTAWDLASQTLVVDKAPRD